MRNMTIKELGDDLFSNIEDIVKTRPYLSFILLGALIEFIAKVSNKTLLNSHTGTSKQDCYNAINNLQALSNYKRFNHTSNNNYLYSHLRCGMLHTLLPNDHIILTSETNDLANNIVGAKSLFDDLKKSWQEIMQNKDIEKFATTTTALVISNQESGSTESNLTKLL